MNVELRNFDAGSYLLRCVWWHSESNSERVPIVSFIDHPGGGSVSLDRHCSFNVRAGRSVHVTVDGERSNTLSFTGRAPQPPPSPPPPPPPPPPSRPSSPVVAGTTVVNDDPDLLGPAGGWNDGYVGKGYGVNNYVYTYAVGGDDAPRNRAVWEMGRRVGRQVVEFFIPCGHASATVTYRITADGSRLANERIDQGRDCGWVRQGPYDFDGAAVTIGLDDNDAVQHVDRNGSESSRIGVDAVAMRCVARCSASEEVAAPVEVRIEARRSADGSVEFRLDVGGVKWLPAARFLAYASAPVGSWLRSSPYVLEPSAAVPGGPTPGADPPTAVMTPAGVPVAVLEVTDGGYLVRTPCGNTAEVTGGEPIGPVRVVVDPGHGGPANPGTVGPNGLVERDLNMRLAAAVLGELTARGISATLTRTRDYEVSHAVRAAFADALGAEAMVSIHHNGPTWSPTSGPGTEVYRQSTSDDSARLARVLYDEIVEALSGFEDVAWTGLADAGVKHIKWITGGDWLAMMRLPVTTTALIEYGYLTNASEAELFATDAYLTAAADATADGIEAYLDTDRTGTGFIAAPRVYPASPGNLRALRCTDTALQ